MPIDKPSQLSILIKLREDKKLTQEEVALFFGLQGKKGRDSVGSWERGQNIPRSHRREKFIEYLSNN